MPRRRRLHRLRADRGAGLRHQRQRQRRRGRHLVERRRRLGADRRFRHALRCGLRGQPPHAVQPVHRAGQRGRGGPVRGGRLQLHTGRRPGRRRRNRRRRGRQPAGTRPLCPDQGEPCHGPRVGRRRGGRPGRPDLVERAAQLRRGGRVRRRAGGRAGRAPSPQRHRRQLRHRGCLGHRRGRRAGRRREPSAPGDRGELRHRERVGHRSPPLGIELRAHHLRLLPPTTPKTAAAASADWPAARAASSGRATPRARSPARRRSAGWSGPARGCGPVPATGIWRPPACASGWASTTRTTTE